MTQPGPATDGLDPEQNEHAKRALFERTLIRVMTMQVVALLILGLLQLRYS